MEDKLREAIVDELRRQAEVKPEKLSVEPDADRLRINGEVDIDALVMVITGSVAGGP